MGTWPVSIQAFYAFDHMNHELMSDECGCKGKQEQREQEAKLLEEQERREKQRLVSKVHTYVNMMQQSPLALIKTDRHPA